MEITAERIAQHFNGEIIGDPQVKVSSVAKIESGKSGNICFLANPKYEKYLYTSKASIIIINRSFKPAKDVAPTLILVDNAYEAVASLLDLLNALKKARKSGRSLFSRRAWSSKIGKGVYIGSFSYVGRKSVVGKGTQIYPQVYIGNDVQIGENVTLYQGVKIYDGCKIGDNCIIHANAVIGSDGFGFAPTADGSYKKIPQTGNVVVEENVEIGANTVIDRATMGSTIIRKGVKLDNLIQVAHNVEIGEEYRHCSPDWNCRFYKNRPRMPVRRPGGNNRACYNRRRSADRGAGGSAGQRKARKGDIVGNSGDRLHGVYEGLCFIP